MSDYISLEELRAMSGTQLVTRWQRGEFPFDTAECHRCVTQHKYYTLCKHKDFQQQTSGLKIGSWANANDLRTNLAEIYALRMFHRDLYPSTPEPPIHGETVPLQGKQGEPVAAEEPRVLAAK